MAVDETGMMFTQRKDPKLALVSTQIINDEEIVSMNVDGDNPILFNIAHDGKVIEATVHSSTDLKTIDQGDRAARFISDVLGKKARIVRMTDDYIRQIKPEYVDTLSDNVSNQVGLADGATISLASNSSLKLLNQWIKEVTPGYPQISFDNLRTNLETDNLEDHSTKMLF